MTPSSVTAALAAAAAICTAGAQASTLIGSQYSAATQLYTLNQTTGTLSGGPATGLGDIGDLASSGMDNTVWGVGINANTLYHFNASNGAVIATVPITGSLTVTGAPEKIVSIAYDSRNNVIYGTSDLALGGGTNDLFRINTTTGAATLVGNFQVDSMYALAWNTVDGFLYGAAGAFGAASSFWKISTATAASTFIGDLTSTGNFDIAFRPEDNVLFMASSGSNALYTVNTATAAETLVGSYGSATNIAGLAFAGAVPEPETWAMMAAGMLALASCVRRRGTSAR